MKELRNNPYIIYDNEEFFEYIIEVFLKDVSALQLKKKALDRTTE